MRKNHCRLIVPIVASFVTIAASTSLLQAQAAAEYTLGTSKAATGAVGFGKAMNRSLSKATGKLSDNLKTSLHESPVRVMQENRTALEKSAKDDGGTLRLVSNPDDAAVFVDGKLVARTPAEIKVPAGDHTIMITRPDRDQWTKQVAVAKGETTEVSAKLVNTNPSVISLDFPDSKK